MSHAVIHLLGTQSFRVDGTPFGASSACGRLFIEVHTTDPAAVTCKSCRKRMSGAAFGAVSLSAYDFGALAIYATRYALGRQSYAVADVCAMLRAQWTRLRNEDRETILRDIRRRFVEAEQLERHAVAACDAGEWRSVLALGEEA